MKYFIAALMLSTGVSAVLKEPTATPIFRALKGNCKVKVPAKPAATTTPAPAKKDDAPSAPSGTRRLTDKKNEDFTIVDDMKDEAQCKKVCIENPKCTAMKYDFFASE